MGAEPRDFQRDAVSHHVAVIRKHGASAEASVPGFGKTYVGGFVAREMKHRPVVVCPKVVIPHWQRALADCGVVPRFVSNYEQFKLLKTELGEWERKPAVHRRPDGSRKKTTGGTWRWTFPKPTLLIFDEAHYCKSRTSQNAKLMLAARRQGIPTLAMSATLAVDPLDLYATGYLLGLHDGDLTFPGFLAQYGCLRLGFDWEFCPRHDPTALDRLNRLIFPEHGHRKSYEQIPGFPAATTTVTPVPGDPDALQKLAVEWERVREIEQLKQEAVTAVVERLRARQIAELAKVPAIVEMARDFINSGLSVPIFLNFHDSIDAVARELKAGVIDGRASPYNREQYISEFQDDRRHVLVLQSQAGGVGISLHDVRGVRPRHSILSPGDDSRALIQCLGRNRRDGAKSPAFRTILTLSGSIESVVQRRLEQKINQIDTINDGDLDPLS